MPEFAPAAFMDDSHWEERRKLIVKLKLPAAHAQLPAHGQRLLQLFPIETRTTTAFQQESSDPNALRPLPPEPENAKVDSPQSLLVAFPLPHANQHLPNRTSSDATAQAHLDSSPSEVALALPIASLLIARQDDATTTAGASATDFAQSDSGQTGSEYSPKDLESECIKVSKPRPACEDAPQPRAHAEPTQHKRVSISINDLLRPVSEEPISQNGPNETVSTYLDVSRVLPATEATYITPTSLVPMSQEVATSHSSPVRTAKLPARQLDADMQEPDPYAHATAAAIAVTPHTPQTAHVTLKLSPDSMAKLSARFVHFQSAHDYGRERNPRRTATKAFGAVKTPERAAPKTKVRKKLVDRKEPAPDARPSKRGAQGNLEQGEVKRQKTNRTSPTTRSSPGPINAPALFPDPSAARSFQQDPITGEPRPIRDVDGDSLFVQHMMRVLEDQSTSHINDTAKEQSITMKAILARATVADDDEALFLTASEATDRLSPGKFWNNVIITAEQQPLPLQTIDQFLREFYEETALVWIQDSSAKSGKQAPSIRQVSVKAVRERFARGKLHPKPWNLLELATHHEDGLRPKFLNNEDCRLLTKLKIPDAVDHSRRKTYPAGFKEVEKWALLAQAGALTLPHQDSHGYSTYITVNVGLVGFGWLSSPTPAKRAEWNKNTQKFIEGPWRYVVLKPGQTVYFPAGTVHFVFRLPSAGNTLAFGGHVLRCSNIVHWVRCLLEEVQSANVTNEDLTDSATGYLGRVERYVKQARKNGDSELWGGEESIKEFLVLKAKFTGRKQRAK